MWNILLLLYDIHKIPYSFRNYLSLKTFEMQNCANMQNKLGLSCAKLRPAWVSYQFASVYLAFAEAAYFAYQSWETTLQGGWGGEWVGVVRLAENKAN